MYYEFKNAFFFSVSGKDAKRYINARITNDINLLESSNVIQTAILNAQGKTKGLFSVLKNDDNYIFISENGENSEVIKAFKQFIVADQVNVELLDYKLFHIDILNFKSSLNFKYSKNRTNQNGIDIIVTNAEEQNTLKTELEKLSEYSKDEFNFLRTKNRNLTFKELEDLFFPEAELINAYSTNKGCYCGQEAVEMVLARGKLPAIIVSAIGDQDLTKVNSNKIFKDKEKTIEIGAFIGEASFSKDNNKTSFFIRLRKEREVEHFFLDNEAKLSLNKI